MAPPIPEPPEPAELIEFAAHDAARGLLDNWRTALRDDPDFGSVQMSGDVAAVIAALRDWREEIRTLDRLAVPDSQPETSPELIDYAANDAARELVTNWRAALHDDPDFGTRQMAADVDGVIGVLQEWRAEVAGWRRSTNPKTGGRMANTRKRPMRNPRGFTGKGRGGPPPARTHKMRWKPDRYTVEQIVEDLRRSDPDLSHTFNIARDLPVYEWGEDIDWEDPELDLTVGLYPVPHDIMWGRLYEGDEDDSYSTWISNHVDMKEVEALLRDYGFIQVESAYTGERDTWVLPRTLREGTGRWPQSWSDLEGNPEDSPPVDTSKLEV